MFHNSPFKDAIVEELGERIKELGIMQKFASNYDKSFANELRRYVETAVMELGDVEEPAFCRAELMAIDELADDIVQYIRMSNPVVTISTVRVSFSLVLAHPVGADILNIFNEIDYNFVLDTDDSRFKNCRILDSNMVRVEVK